MELYQGNKKWAMVYLSDPSLDFHFSPSWPNLQMGGWHNTVWWKVNALSKQELLPEWTLKGFREKKQLLNEDKLKNSFHSERLS